MTDERVHCCAMMQGYIDDKEVPIMFIEKFREYGIMVLDGGSSYIILANCPWCGAALPKSLRMEWFDALDKLGLEPDSLELPIEYTDDRWYRGVI